MKIGVLTRNPEGYTMDRFRETADKRGHELKVLDTLNFSLHVAEEKPDLGYGEGPCPDVDAIIPRIGHTITMFGTAVVRQFEQMGTFCVNGSAAINQSRDKLRSMQILSRHTIGIPDTAFVRQRRDVLPAIERVGGVPVIIKLLEGSQGVGVILADTVKVAEAIIETLQASKQSVLIQRFVSESRGTDVRAVVVGDRVVAAMRRRAQGQEFRSNVHRGGSVEKVDLDPRYEKAAIRAAHILGLRFAGVDMLEAKGGPQVMEVNSSPGLEGVESATGVDVAGELFDLIEREAKFPDVDLRQRLSVGSGYAVVEMVVDADSPLAGTTIADSNLRDEEVLVLNVERGGLKFPAPRGAQELMAGDKLLLFGKQLTLEALISGKSESA